MKPVYALAIFIFFLLAISPSLAQGTEFNSKSVQSITLRIMQSGQLTITGSIDKMNLSLYIPQEGVQNLDINSNQPVSWKYAQDNMGNRIVVLEWAKSTGIVTYQIEITVINNAKLRTSLPNIGNDPKYLGQTPSIVVNDDIRKLAFPFDKTWENVARLTKLVNELIEYDLSTVGQRYPSDWVLENRRGVCVEHANLLTAMLRASSIPTRYVVGYAYSTVDKKLIGHTWVEVLANDGTWIPFDPTWLQGGYVDATHIKTANLIDDNQLDVLTYLGNGQVTWKRGSSATQSNRRLTGDLYGDTVDIIRYTTRNLTHISLSASEAGLDNFGYIKASVNADACIINQLTAVSCVDKDDKDVLGIFEDNQTFFSCSSRDVYWFYKERGSKNPYICPVNVFDQIGSVESIDIDIDETKSAASVSISGPSVVNVGEQFTLTANAQGQFIFYSPEFGLNQNKDWGLKISRAGKYKFYLYSGSNLAVKEINAVEQKAFDIKVEAPLSIRQYSIFSANISVKNLLSPRIAKLSVEFDSQKFERELGFDKNEQKTMQFSFNATSQGQKELVVMIIDNTITPHTANIFVDGTPQKGKGVLDAIIAFFASIVEFFANLL